jgi:hypothetical protein
VTAALAGDELMFLTSVNLFRRIPYRAVTTSFSDERVFDFLVECSVLCKALVGVYTH